MATYSSILAWGILWAEEPGGLPSVQNQASDCQLACCPEGTVTPVDPCGVEVE